MASPTSRVSTPTSPADVGEGERDFSQSQLKPAPLRLTRKSLSSTTDHGLFQDAREVQPDDSEPLPLEHQHHGMLPLSSPLRPAGSGLAGLVSRFEVLGMTSQQPLRPSSRQQQHQGKPPGTTTGLKRSAAARLDPTLLTTGGPMHETGSASPSHQGSMGDIPPIRTSKFPGESSSRRNSARGRTSGPTALHMSGERNGWDLSLVAERRKMFENPFDWSRSSFAGQQGTSAKPTLTQAAVATGGGRIMPPKILLPKSATWTYDQHVAYHHSTNSSTSSVSDLPILKKHQPPAEPHSQAAVANQRQKKSVADLRRSFELTSRSTSTGISGDSPAKAVAASFTPNKALSMTDRLAGWVTLPAAAPAQESVVRARELPRNSAAFAGLWPKADASDATAAANSTLRPTDRVLLAETPTPTRPEKRSAILHSSPIHPFLLPSKTASKTASKKASKDQALESAAGTAKSGAGPLVNAPDGHGPSAVLKSSPTQLVDDDGATKVADLRRLFDRHSHTAPFLPFLSKRRETAPTKASPASPTLDFNTGALANQAQPGVANLSTAGLAPEPAATRRVEGRGQTVPSKVKHRPNEGISDSGIDPEARRRRHKLRKKRRDSPVKDRICLFESLSQSSLSLTTTSTAQAKSHDTDADGKRRGRGSGELGRTRLSSWSSSRGSRAWQRFSAGATLRDRRKTKTKFSADVGESLDESQGGDAGTAVSATQPHRHPQGKGKQRGGRFSLKPTHTLRFRRNSSIFHVTSTVQRISSVAAGRMPSESQPQAAVPAADTAARDAAAGATAVADTGSSSLSSAELVDEDDHTAPNVVLHASATKSDRVLPSRKSYGALERKAQWASNLGVDGTPAETCAGILNAYEVRPSMTAPHVRLGLPGLGMGIGFGIEMGAVPVVHLGRGRGAGSASSRQSESRRSSGRPPAEATTTTMTPSQDGRPRFRHSSSWGRVAGAVPFSRRRRKSQGGSSPAALEGQDDEKLSHGSDSSQRGGANASWSRRAAAAAFGIGQRLREQRRASNHDNNNNNNNDNKNIVCMHGGLGRCDAGADRSEGADIIVAANDDMVVATPECGLQHPRPSRVLNLTRFKSFGKDRAKASPRL